MNMWRWLVLLATLVLSVLFYISFSIVWAEYWKKKFFFLGDWAGFLFVVVFTLFFVQLLKYIWRWEVRTLFRERRPPRARR